MIVSRKIGPAVAALGLLAWSAGQAHAGMDLTLAPSSGTNVVGNAGTSAPGFGTGSWQAPSSGKSELYIAPSSLFGRDVTIGEIGSITYWTNKGTTAADPDWTLLLYTKLQSSGNTGSWYHTRLNAEPYFTQTTSVAANTWHKWSTNDPTNPLLFFDQPRSGNFGTYNDPTLAELQAAGTYNSEVINLFSLQTGSGWANGFTGLVDGLTITLTGGETATVNLEAVAAAVPEPSTLASAGLAGAIFLGLAWRRRRAKPAA